MEIKEKKKWEVNKLIYNNKYQKENYKQFKTILKNEEMDAINELLNELNMSKADFLRYAYEELKKTKNN